MDEARLAGLGREQAVDRLRVDFLAGLVALDTGVHVRRIRADGRDAEIARARQIAMYLAHVGFGWPLQRVGSVFGRHPTTVSRACHVVEDLREDKGFDIRLTALEDCVKAAPEMPAGADA